MADGLWRLLLTTLYLAVQLSALGAIGLFISTLTEQPIGATIAVVLVNVMMFICDQIPQLAWLHPWLLVHWWTGLRRLPARPDGRRERDPRAAHRGRVRGAPSGCWPGPGSPARTSRPNGWCTAPHCPVRSRTNAPMGILRPHAARTPRLRRRRDEEGVSRSLLLSTAVRDTRRSPLTSRRLLGIPADGAQPNTRVNRIRLRILCAPDDRVSRSVRRGHASRDFAPGRTDARPGCTGRWCPSSAGARGCGPRSAGPGSSTTTAGARRAAAGDLDLGAPGRPAGSGREFGRSAPLIVEIGPGPGESLVPMARARPEATCSPSRSTSRRSPRSWASLAPAGVDNVRLVAADAVAGLTHLLPDARWPSCGRSSPIPGPRPGTTSAGC